MFESKTFELYMGYKDLDESAFRNKFFGSKDIILNSWLYIVKQELDEYFENLKEMPPEERSGGQEEPKKSRSRKTRSNNDDPQKRELKKAKNRIRRLTKKAEEKQAELEAVEVELEQTPEDEFLFEKKNTLEREVEKAKEQLTEAEAEVTAIEGDEDGSDS